MAKYLDLAGLSYYNSKIQAQLAGMVGGMKYQGTFNASTGKDGVGTELPTPAVGNKGQYWICTVAGTFSDVAYEPKDWIVSNGADGWAKVDNTDPIYLGSTSITLNGNAFQRAALTGDVTASANSNATTIGTGKVTEAKIAANAVTSSKIKDGAVTTVKIIDDAVTEAKLADQSVTTAKIGNGAVETTNIANGAVTEDKIKDGAVTGTKLGVEAIYDTNISQHAYINLSKLDTIPGETILGNYGGTDGKPAALEASQVRGILNVADGANNYTHPSYTAKSAGLYKITVDATGHVSAATAVAKADITALGIPAQDTVYTLPEATSSVLGGVKVSGTVYTATPTALTTANGRTYAVQKNSAGVLAVNVPWTDQQDTAITNSEIDTIFA